MNLLYEAGILTCVAKPIGLHLEEGVERAYASWRECAWSRSRSRRGKAMFDSGVRRTCRISNHGVFIEQQAE